MASKEHRVFVPFSGFSPDLGEIRNPGLLTCKNVFPYSDGFIPAYSYKDAALLAHKPLGKIFVNLQNSSPSAYDYTAYYGSTTKLFSLRGQIIEDELTLTESDVSKAFGYTVSTSDPWCMVPFGDHMIATSRAEPMQIRLSGAGNFQDCVTSTEKPRPRFLAVWGNQIAAANIGATGVTQGSGVDSVWISGVDNARVYGTSASHPADSTNYFYLKEISGPITGLMGGREFGLVFKQNGIYRVDYMSEFTPQFRVISRNFGTVFNNSIVPVETDVYFWANGSGPAVVRQDTVVPLGFDKITRSLLDTDFFTLDPPVRYNTYGTEPYSFYGAFDQASCCVFWVIPEGVNALGINLDEGRFAICYSVKTGQFSVVDFSNLSGAHPTNPTMASIFEAPPVSGFTHAPGIVWVLRDEVSLVERSRAVYCSLPVNGDHHYVNGCVFKTGYVDYAEGFPFRVTSVRPIFTLRNSGSGAGVSVTVNTRSYPNGPDSTSTETLESSVSGDGSIMFSDTQFGRLSQIQITFESDGATSTHPATNIGEIEGFEIGIKTEDSRVAFGSSPY